MKLKKSKQTKLKIKKHKKLTLKTFFELKKIQSLF
jgi:hypothetical protein